MKTILPIYFNTKESTELENVGVDTGLEKLEIKEVYFYRIDAVADYDNNGVICSSIYNGGGSWICPLTKEEVDERINRFVFN